MPEVILAPKGRSRNIIDETIAHFEHSMKGLPRFPYRKAKKKRRTKAQELHRDLIVTANGLRRPDTIVYQRLLPEMEAPDAEEFYVWHEYGSVTVRLGLDGQVQPFWLCVGPYSRFL